MGSLVLAVICRIMDSWNRHRTDASSSEDGDVQGASMRAVDSSGALSALVSDSSRQLSSLSSPFGSKLPGSGNAAGDKSRSERADEDIARKMFCRAQARRRGPATEQSRVLPV